MATQTVEFRAATGLTITAKLFSAGSDTEVASVSATEATNRKGTYRAAYTDVAAGEYQLIAFDSQPIPVASWWVTLTLTTATFVVYEKADTRDLATSTGVTAAFTEIKGTGWSSGTDTLEKIAESASGGTVTVAPLSSLAPERVNGTTISVAVGDVSPVSIDVYDANGVAIDLTAQGNLEVCIESRDNVDLQVVAHASITISGTGNRKATWTPNAAAVGTVDKQRWSLRTASGKRVLAYGSWVVERVALNDA
jgi:hypothetical protein